MAAKTTWTEIEPPAITCLPEKVFLRSEDLVARQGFVRHTHPWNQLVYATAGTLLVTVENIWYVITPEQAIWIPTGVPHTTGTLNGATFRNLYIENVPNLSMPDVCTVYAVNDLLKGLIVGLEDAEQNKEPVSYLELLHALILEQIKRLKVQDFHLPWPQNSRLQKLCEHLYAHPADFRSLDEWVRNWVFPVKHWLASLKKKLGLHCVSGGSACDFFSHWNCFVLTAALQISRSILAMRRFLPSPICFESKWGAHPQFGEDDDGEI